MIELVSQCLEQKVYKHKINIAFMSYTAKNIYKKINFSHPQTIPPLVCIPTEYQRNEMRIFTPNDKYDSIFIKGDVDHILNKMR